LAIDLDEKAPAPDWEQLRSLARKGTHGLGSLREFRSNADGSVLLMQVQIRQLTSRVNKTQEILSQAAADINALQPAAFHPKLQARLYGGLRFRAEEYNSILRDLARASIMTFPLMLLIPALVLRSYWEPLVVLVPVAAGMAWTYAAAWFLFGSLNLVTCFLFLILFGIGDDYPIHLLYRIREEIQRGTAIREGIACAIRSTAAPLGFSALTNLGGFVALAWMQFRGFSQFGVIAGIGVCLILVATLVTVPGIVWLIRSRLGTGKRKSPSAASSLRATRAGREHLLKWRFVLLVVSMWAILAGGSAWMVSQKLEFEQDFENLRPDFRELRELRDKAESIEGYQRSSPAVFFTPDFEASREIARVVQARLDNEGTRSPIGRVLSLASILDGDTASKRARLAGLLTLLDDPVLRQAPAEIRADIEALRDHLDLSPLTLEGIPLDIRRSLTRPIKGPGGEERELYLVVVEPRNRVSLTSEALAFANRLQAVESHGQPFVPAGEALIFAEVLRLVRQEGWVVIALAWVATAALVYMAFRSWTDLVALLVTMAGALSISLAVLAGLGMRLNFFNLAVLPLLVGLGINYGIHLLHRYHEEGMPATHAARRLAPSVGSAAATTVVGFAGLLLAQHPGLWSMGFTASVGIGIIALSCLLFLPSLADLLALLRTHRHPASHC
jgi:predicted RND superfamily exporter protein